MFMSVCILCEYAAKGKTILECKCSGSTILIKIPEGVEQLQENEPINVQVLFGCSGLGDCPNRGNTPART
jgi:hypothetical protein